MPIYIGTFPYSPQMLRLPGELADTVALVGVPGLGCVARAEIAKGAARIGRDPHAVHVGAYIVLSVDEDAGRARDACGPVIAAYARRAVLWVEGLVPSDDLEPIHSAYEICRPAMAAAAVDDRLVDRIAIVGDPAYCHDRLAE